MDLADRAQSDDVGNHRDRATTLIRAGWVASGEVETSETYPLYETAPDLTGAFAVEGMLDDLEIDLRMAASRLEAVARRWSGRL